MGDTDPRNVGTAVGVLPEAIAAGVNRIDTRDFYGPHVTDQIIKQALCLPGRPGDRFQRSFPKCPCGSRAASATSPGFSSNVGEGAIMTIGGWRTGSGFERYAIVSQADIAEALGKARTSWRA